MSRRNFAQSSLADAFVKAYSRGGGFLQDLLETINWAAIDALFAQINANTKGAPGYPPLVMFKIVLLQQWYNLSDPAAEEAVRDRLSFRRFCGAPLDCETPDHSSIWRFRQMIDKLGLSEKLLEEVNRQLDARGLIVKRGTLVDATIIAAAVARLALRGRPSQRPRPRRLFHHQEWRDLFRLQGASGGGRGQRDRAQVVTRLAEMSSADLHDSQRGEAMIQGDEQAYYGDKAYDSKALRATLTEQGIDDKIAYKAQRNKPLVHWQKWFNRTASSVRVGVERSNATMKRWYGMARVRYLGLARNNCHLQFVVCAMNMKRALVLLAA